MIQPDPSIVFSVFWKPFANKFGIRTILDSRSIPVEVVNFWKKIDQLFYNVSIVLAKKYFDGISVLTYQMKLNICQRFNIKEDFIGVWGSGVSVELFEPDKYTENNLRANLGLDHKFIIFYHGTMGVKRGLIESVNAINLLKVINDDITLFFLGEGDSRPIIEKLIYKYNLQNKIIIHDVVDFEEVPKFISICDTGIVPLPDMPDWRHQEPLKILEYLSMEKPIILTDIPAHRHIIGDNKCGIFISSANPMDISKGIKYAYDNRDKIQEWGKNGRRIVMNNYTWEKVSEDLIDFLFNILNN